MEHKDISKAVHAALLVCCVGFAPSALAEASAQMLANNCVGCHGPDGNSVGPASPSIAGETKTNFINKMESYKSEGGRYSTIMGRIAKGYDEKEIDLMAGYFSAIKRTNLNQTVDAKMAAKGAKIHDKTCSKCHEKPEDDDIILDGQLRPYLLNSMHDFSQLDPDSIESKDLKKMVKNLKELSMDERAAIADYYAGKK